jgi:CRISPR-associated protein Cmr2
MQYDYYAFRKEQLGDHLSELEQASAELVQAKKQRDKNARQQAEKKIEQAAEKLVRIEPHLSYLWYEAQGSELKNLIRDAWQKYLTTSPIPNDFHFSPNPSDLHHLPSHSFMLHVPFKLCKPYLSKDDRTFHLLDNSVRKDKVFQTPMIASTSWKGALRVALWQLDHKADDETIVRLFGNAREDEKGQAGRLYFYPTFFDKIGLEVINPHDRKTGTGKTGPILLECVPANAIGEFVLLYVPFGPVKSDEVAADLTLVAEGIQEMLTVYGFGAKTSSGFGIADIQGKGELAIRADLPDLAETLAPAKHPEFLNDDGSFNPEFLNDGGELKSQGQYKKSCQRQGKTYDENLYKEAKQFSEVSKQDSASDSRSRQPMAKKYFASWSELDEQVQLMADQLNSRGEA